MPPSIIAETLYLEIGVQIKMHQTKCTEFCKCKALCETGKDVLKNNFWRKWPAAIKKKKIVVVFADFFLLYVYYDFILVLFSYRNYFIQKLCIKENHKRSFLYLTWIFFILCFLYKIKAVLSIISSFLVCLTWDADFVL